MIRFKSRKGAKRGPAVTLSFHPERFSIASAMFPVEKSEILAEVSTLFAPRRILH